MESWIRDKKNHLLNITCNVSVNIDINYRYFPLIDVIDIFEVLPSLPKNDTQLVKSVISAAYKP